MRPKRIPNLEIRGITRSETEEGLPRFSLTTQLGLVRTPETLEEFPDTVALLDQLDSIYRSGLANGSIVKVPAWVSGDGRLIRIEKTSPSLR